MQQTRRCYLMGASALALSLAACSTLPGPSNPPAPQPNPVPTWVNLFRAVATEIGQALPQLQSITLPNGATLVSAGLSDKVQNIIVEVQSVLGTIGSTSSAVQGKSVLATVEGYLNALAPLIAPFVAVIPGGSIIGLIVAALPAIESAVNMLISVLSPAAQQLAGTAPAVPAQLQLRSAKLRAAGAPRSTADAYALMLLAAAAQSRASRSFRRRFR